MIYVPLYLHKIMYCATKSYTEAKSEHESFRDARARARVCDWSMILISSIVFTRFISYGRFAWRNIVAVLHWHVTRAYCCSQTRSGRTRTNPRRTRENPRRNTVRGDKRTVVIELATETFIIPSSFSVVQILSPRGQYSIVMYTYPGMCD